MKKSGILMIALMAAAGITSVSAQEIDFDRAGPAVRGLGEMAAESAGIEAVEASKPLPVTMTEPWNIDSTIPVPSEQALFMNEAACSILDASFLAQPSKDEAAETLKPCLAALSGKYRAALKLLPGKNGLNLLVGDAKNPGKELRNALRVQLKVKADGRFFGHKVDLYVPRAGATANKGWLDDANTVVNFVVDSIHDAANDMCGAKCDRPSYTPINTTPRDDRPITSTMSW